MCTTFQFRIFYLPVPCLEIEGLKYTKLKFLWMQNLVSHLTGRTGLSVFENGGRALLLKLLARSHSRGWS